MTDPDGNRSDNTPRESSISNLPPTLREIGLPARVHNHTEWLFVHAGYD
jgi:hypothetical protein